MFELDGEATPAEILHSAASLRRARIEVDNAVLLHAVAWADRNGPETIHPDQLAVRGGARPVQLGGDNTPEVNDLAPAELGAALGLSTGAAAGLVADSLDLRHRLPNLWAKICDCSFPGWQGRKIAQHTRALTAEQAAQVDRRLAGYAGTIAWTRLERFLDAVVADIDATNAEKEADMAQREHRLFTHARWQRRQPQTGTLLVRTPHGQILLTNNTGTHDLGNDAHDTFAHTIWRAAAPCSADPTGLLDRRRSFHLFNRRSPDVASILVSGRFAGRNRDV